MFEQYVYDGRGNRRSGREALSVRPTGVIGIGQRLVHEHDLGTATDAILFYDEQTDQIAVKFLQEPQYGSVPIRSNGNPPHRSITHGGFAKRHELEAAEYRLVEKNEGGLFIFGQNEAENVLAGTRYAIVEIPGQLTDAELEAALELVGGKRA